MFGARNFGAPSRFISEIPAELTDRESQAPRAFGGDARAGDVVELGPHPRPGPAAAATQPPPPAFRLGDDVVHAAFGEGVVTGWSPAGSSSSASATDRHRAQARRRPGADLQALTCPAARRGSNTVER